MDQCPLMVLDSQSETNRRLSPLVESLPLPPGAPAGTSFSDKSVTTQGLPIHNQSFPAPIKTESSEPGLVCQSICGPIFSCFANTPSRIGADGHTPPTNRPSLQKLLLESSKTTQPSRTSKPEKTLSIMVPGVYQVHCGHCHNTNACTLPIHKMFHLDDQLTGLIRELGC
ncbi:hypothetical protein CH063_14504 [Colletotrichum higginsianum]|uniref:Uncharacterized protein n=1 Tax=Colletotrichum higginsianum (strain IMI 349063) TaxID=759273 RepID=H1VYT9_COLHI|nr:hypothetical protein CH063_14504 [Colletotrichum higginsianum]